MKYKKPDKKTETDETRSESSVDSLAVKQSNLKGIAAASHIKAFVFLSAAFKEPPFRGEQEEKVVHCLSTERPFFPPKALEVGVGKQNIGAESQPFV